MDSAATVNLEPPRFEHIELLLIAGTSERYASDIAGIPEQWQRFAPHIGTVPGQTGYATFGVCYNGDDAGAFDYLCGVEVTSIEGLGREWECVRIAQERFAVFHSGAHISAMFATISAIWNTWLPASEYERVRAPWFEKYGADFDGDTGFGGFEIWLPIKARA